MLGTWKIAAVAGAMLVASAAHAESRTFYQACDGYGSPTSNGGGMTKEASGLFGLIRPLGASGNTRRIRPPLGADGVAACDRALADAGLIAKHWLRRASLLRARALHQLALNRQDEALADLDRATAAIASPDDVFVKRSLVAGLKLTRAYALAAKGDRLAAAPLAFAVQAERPYDRQVGLMAFAITGAQRAQNGGEPALRQIAKVDPRLINLLFLTAFDNREFDQMADLFVHLAAPKRIVDTGISGAEQRRQTAEGQGTELDFMADSYGRLAYAYAASRRPALAGATLDAGRAWLTAHTPPAPPPPLPGTKENGKERQRRELVAELARTSTASVAKLNIWAKHDVLRNLIESAPIEQALAALEQWHPPADPLTLEMLQAFQRKLPTDMELAATVARLEAETKRGPATNLAGT